MINKQYNPIKHLNLYIPNLLLHNKIFVLHNIKPNSPSLLAYLYSVKGCSIMDYIHTHNMLHLYCCDLFYPYLYSVSVFLAPPNDGKIYHYASSEAVLHHTHNYNEMNNHM